MNTPLLHSIQSSTQMLGIGRSSLYGLIGKEKSAQSKLDEGP